MKKQTRISIIREAIKFEDGDLPTKAGFDYYADGPNSDCASAVQRRANETIYKVPNDTCNLSIEARQRVVDALRKHSEIKDAYLSRPYKHPYRKVSEGNHIKVVFQN